MNMADSYAEHLEAQFREGVRDPWPALRRSLPWIGAVLLAVSVLAACLSGPVRAPVEPDGSIPACTTAITNRLWDPEANVADAPAPVQCHGLSNNDMGTALMGVAATIGDNR